MTSKPIGLVNRRKALELTQKQVAEAVGVTSRTVQSWELGENLPRLTPLQYMKLLSVLQCSPEDLAKDFFPEAFGPANAAESGGKYA